MSRLFGINVAFEYWNASTFSTAVHISGADALLTCSADVIAGRAGATRAAKRARDMRRVSFLGARGAETVETVRLPARPERYRAIARRLCRAPK